MSKEAFLTPAQVAEQEETRLPRELAMIRKAAHEALTRGFMGRDYILVLLPKRMSKRSLDDIAAELSEAGWSVRRDSEDGYTNPFWHLKPAD